jgi:hypothetical protein
MFHSEDKPRCLVDEKAEENDEEKKTVIASRNVVKQAASL